MKLNLWALLLFISTPIVLNAQEKTDFGIKFSGFVKNDFFYDSRQTTSIREGHFLLYPSAFNPDANGKDISDVSNFNFLSIQSRLSGKITGPDALGAKTSGILEADFFGNENANFVDANGFRLRHAAAKLNWEKTELLFGQSWNPLFVANCSPGVISFNTGVPMQPFSRNPQIRVTQTISKFSIIGALASQRDFQSPNGNTNSIRNSSVPEMHVQLHWGTKNDSAKTEILAGIGGEYKYLRPRLNSEVPFAAVGTTPAGVNKYAMDETFGSFIAIAFAKVKIPAITAKVYGLYGQNTFDQTMLGGYAVDTITNASTGKLNYIPVNIMSTWLDVTTNGSFIQFGVFAGYTKNLGLEKTLGFKKNSNVIAALKSTSRGYDLNSVLRVSPRLVLNASSKLSLNAEVEYTMANYAAALTDIDSNGKVNKTKSVSNVRALFSVIYNF